LVSFALLFNNVQLSHIKVVAYHISNNHAQLCDYFIALTLHLIYSIFYCSSCCIYFQFKHGNYNFWKESRYTTQSTKYLGCTLPI